MSKLRAKGESLLGILVVSSVGAMLIGIVAFFLIIEFNWEFKL